MDRKATGKYISDGNAILGIELGSTRIKAVLIGEDHAPIAMGSHIWENRLENGVWTYRIADVWAGMQDAYAQLRADVNLKYDVDLEKLAGMGISAMMHGYLPFDKDGNQLAEFRTWRNTMTEKAAAALTEMFDFNIPQRWSIAHLTQAIMNEEAHLSELDFLTTLSGYIHWQLTGQKVLGVGEASGMFPIDSQSCDYDQRMIETFEAKFAGKYPWRLRDILPKVLSAGEDAGTLTAQGALKLDVSGHLKPGVPVCPPEGDAGTGMVATNSVSVRTGNISAGTSIFSMVVLERPLSRLHTEIDMVTTPDGMPVAMVHCNNCTSDINAWADILAGFAAASGKAFDMGDVYTALFKAALDGEKDCGGFVNVNYLSGEPITGLEAGRPMMVRLPETRATFANFARALLCGAVVTLRLGMDILSEEDVRIDSLLGHGGFFKTKDAGQTIMAAALNAPVSVMETAGEGGPWGMALLAAYAVRKEPGQTLADYLKAKVFGDTKAYTVNPDAADVSGFAAYVKNFVSVLDAQRTAVNRFN